MSSELTYDDILTAINWNPDKQPPRVLAEGEFPAQDRVAAISPPGGGKTITIGGLFNRSISKVHESLHTDTQFKARILENASNLRQDVSDLCDGIFPAKTQFFYGFRSSPGLLLELYKKFGVDVPLTKKFFGRLDNLRPSVKMWHRARQISFNDLPGETISAAHWQYRVKAGTYEQNQALKELVGYAITEMRNCQELMFMADCSKAHGLGLPIEQEVDPNVSRDPDVSLARSFSDIAMHKEKQGDHIKEIFIVLTKWDKLEPKAKDLGFDLFDPNLIRRQKVLEDFTASCFRQFFAELHSHGIASNHIHYYPTFFQTEKDKDGIEIKYEDNVEYMLPNGQYGVKKVRRPHIMKKDLHDPNARNIWQNVNAISYSEESYDMLLNDVMANAPVVKI